MIVFPDKGEAEVYVYGRGGGRRSCSRAKGKPASVFPGRGDGDYVYGREGLCARASTRGRPAFVFPGEGEADDYVYGQRLEGERRFCGNKTKLVQGKSFPVSYTDSELLITLLDIRTVHCKHLTKDQRKKAVDFLKRNM